MRNNLKLTWGGGMILFEYISIPRWTGFDMEGIIERIIRHARDNPEGIAYRVYDERGDGYAVDALTWEQLEVRSNALAAWLVERTRSKTPIVVYGHKSVYMLVCFFACAKSGKAYCPVDVSVPFSRVRDIVDCVEPEVVLSTAEGFSMDGYSVLGPEEIAEICDRPGANVPHNSFLRPEEVYYIIFTSGSTGTPKGVMITRECLENYIHWGLTLGGENMEGCGFCFLNQAPFSFDLSVMDIYLSLYSGGIICAITKAVQGNTRLLYDVLRAANINVWVSTPSFADVCLSDRSFAEALLPNLRRFLFCGEILTNRTVEKLNERFPRAVVVNTYGPTESTVAVTEIVVDEELLKKFSPLPVGYPRRGTWLFIVDEKGERLPDGEWGECVIAGDTVSVGYFKNPRQTEGAFGECEIEGRRYRLYHTGDRCCIKEGMLFYGGRIDFQVKLHGYRIEIEDIENNLVKLDGVQKAAVLPNFMNDQVRSLTAYVVYDGKMDSEFEAAQRIRQALKHYIPEYMVPKKIKFLPALPMTTNGKVDRKKLGDLIK